MSAPKIENLTIVKGDDYSHTVYWETEPIVYKAITGITKGAPARIAAVGHGLTSGWRAAVVSVVGMTAINASTPPKDKEYHDVTVIGNDTVDFNAVNSSGYKTYVSGGYLQYYTAHSLAGYTARMSIKDKVDGTELLRMDTSNFRIVLDDVTKVIELSIAAAITAEITWKKGVYDLELVSAGGVVTKLLTGTVTISSEVTTT